ncbi:MAG: F0F1 ATP synthase subunit alpha [Actinobacteria bacterium]|nr:F0F1 ATP synthase subunit alpha [Actinomycetota bacterium]
MAQKEFSISPEDITAVLQRHLAEFEPSLEREEVGRVREVGDGIARVSGLPRAMANEMLEFEGGVMGLAMNLDVDEIGAVVLGEASHIEEGQPVKQTGQILSVGVGDELLGRVVDALGAPLDGKGSIETGQRRPLEVQAPGVTARQAVNQPMQTGIKAIDAMTPIGRGQRQLIIGDRQTGKTAIAIDTIINQREAWGTDEQVKCIYVAVGQKASTVAEVVGALEEAGAMEYTVVVNAAASDPAPFQYLAPYSGCAMGQHWMENGEDALIVYDNLSQQAVAYRQLSLLLRRPPGREAYPGDVFYLHSRLLERAARLSDENGGGSMTALPIIETKGGDVSAYIPTNVISITDGQIFLETDLFFAGVRPAINVGISVSRVGGNAQTKAMKSVSGRLRLDLAQFRELESFAEFGSDLDKASQAQLERGARLVEALKQPQYSPFPVQDQVISIWAITNGFTDDLPVESVQEFERELLDHMRTHHDDIRDTIRESGKLEDDTSERLKSAVSEFKDSFADRVGTVETVAAEEGVPETSEPGVGGDDTDASDNSEEEDSGSKASSDGADEPAHDESSKSA